MDKNNKIAAISEKKAEKATEMANSKKFNSAPIHPKKMKSGGKFPTGKRQKICQSCGSKYPTFTQNHPEGYTSALDTIGIGSRVASFIPTGAKLPVDTGFMQLESDSIGPKLNGSAVDPENYVISGLATYNGLPVLGSEGGGAYTQYGIANPIEYMSKQVGSKIKESVSRPVGYEGNDLTLYLVGLASIYGAIAAAKRAFTMLYKTNIVNQYLPEGMMNALGFKSDTGLTPETSKPYIKARINASIARLRNYAFPRGFTYLERIVGLNSVILKDQDSEKCQLIVPRQLRYFKLFDENNEIRGVTPVSDIVENTDDKGSNPETWYFSDFLSMIDKMIGKFEDSTAFGTNIQADIRKAFEGNLQDLNDVMDDEAPMIVYDKTALSQMANTKYFPVNTMTVDKGEGNYSLKATTFGYRSAIDQESKRSKLQPCQLQADKVTLEEGFLGTSPAAKGTQMSVGEGSFNYIPVIQMCSELTLNGLDDSTPTDAEIMSATRFKYVPGPFNTFKVEGIQTTGYGIRLASYYCGTEVVVSTTYGKRTGKSAQPGANVSVTKNWVLTNVAQSKVSAMAYMSAFSMYPLFRVVTATVEGAATKEDPVKLNLIDNIGPVAPFNNFTYVYAEQLINMHYAAIGSLFAVSSALPKLK